MQRWLPVITVVSAVEWPGGTGRREGPEGNRGPPGMRDQQALPLVSVYVVCGAALV